MYSVIASATSHPNNIFEYRGLFNKRSLERMAVSGVDISVISPQPYAPPAGPYSDYKNIQKKIQFEEYTLHCPRFLYLLPKNLFYGISGTTMSYSVTKYLRENLSPPDIVHSCHIYLDGYAMRDYSLRHDIPFTVVAHGGKLNSYESFSNSAQQKIDQVLQDTSLIICVSDALEDKAKSIVSSAQTQVIPIGADINRFAQYKKDPVREQFDIDQSTVFILYVGQFINRKGVDVIIDSIDDIETEDKQFIFVGHRGGLNADLRSAIKEHGLEDSVDIRYQVSDETLAKLYVAADLLILPSRAEGRPTVIYEAMASKTAVFATALEGIREQVVDGETGFLHPTPPGPGFVKQMNEITGQKETLEELGENGYKRLLEKNWTWGSHTDRVIKAHKDIIQEFDGY